MLLIELLVLIRAVWGSERVLLLLAHAIPARAIVWLWVRVKAGDWSHLGWRHQSVLERLLGYHHVNHRVHGLLTVPLFFGLLVFLLEDVGLPFKVLHFAIHVMDPLNPERIHELIQILSPSKLEDDITINQRLALFEECSEELSIFPFFCYVFQLRVSLHSVVLLTDGLNE